MCCKSAQLLRIQVLAIIVLVGLDFWAPSVTAHAAFQSTSVKEMESGEEGFVERTDPEPEVTKGHDNSDQAATEQITSRSPATGIIDLAVDASTKEWVKVVISADGILPKVKSFTLPDPSRLIIDVPKVKLRYPENAISFQHALLKKIRMAQNPYGVRIVFDSRKLKLAPYSVDQAAQTITVCFGEQKGEKSELAGTIKAIDSEPLNEAPVEKIPGQDEAAFAGKKPDFPPEFADLAREATILPDASVSKAELPFGPDKVYTGQKVSLDFHNADIHNVLRILAEVSKLNIVAGEDVSGKVTLKLDKVPWDQVLDVVLATNGLGIIRTGNVIRIAPLAKVAEEKKYFIEQQQAEFEARKKVMETEPLITEYIQVNYGKAGALKDQVEKMRSERGSVTHDERTNKIIIKDTPAVIESAKALVRSLDEPTRQVLIEARIVEATADFSRQLGVQWGSGSESNLFQKAGGEWRVGAQGRLGSNFAVNPGIPTTGDALGAIGFTFGRLGTALVNLDVRLLALESDGKVHIVSSPKITTLDNKEAYIQQGSKIPYREMTEEGTVTTAFAEATLKLTVVPHITPDNRINLNISAKKDEPDWTKTVEGVPALDTREAKTELLINDGETVVIGGIIYEKKLKVMAGVPGLYKVPVLGWLFKGEKDATERKELLIFLSANIVKVD